jgi:hypothetical protein
MIDCALWYMWGDNFQNKAFADPAVKPAAPILDQIGGNAAAADDMMTPAEALETETVRSKFWKGKHLLFGEFQAATFPALFSGTPATARESAPMLGEHTNKILKEVGYTDSAVAEMLESKVAISTKSLLKLMKGPSKAIKAFGVIDALQTGNSFAAKQNLPPVIQGGKVDDAAGPLSGVKVVEFASLISGPMASSMLADNGADVVKVELAGTLDQSRAVGPGTGMGVCVLFLKVHKCHGVSVLFVRGGHVGSNSMVLLGCRLAYCCRI